MPPEQSDRQGRTAAPGSLLSQWWTVGRVIRDKRTSGRHVKVMFVIVDRFVRSYGNSRASLRYLERATDLGRAAVVKACRELTEWGYVERRIGSGTRPSEYAPMWAITARGAQIATTGSRDHSGVEMDTACSVEMHTSASSSGVEMHTESYLPSPADRPADGISKTVSASGPGAEAPAEAGGFERIWRSYGRYGNKQASRHAFEAIASPDVDHIASRAAAWAASAKPGQRRMPLEKWLAAEKYDEADRSVRAKPPEPDECQDEVDEVEGRATSSAAEAAECARKIRRSAIEIEVPHGIPLIVVSSAVEERTGDKWLEMQTNHGRVAVLLEGRDEAVQEAGQAHFARLCDACGLTHDIDDGAELHGRTFMVVGDRFAAPTAQKAA